MLSFFFFSFEPVAIAPIQTSQPLVWIEEGLVLSLVPFVLGTYNSHRLCLPYGSSSCYRQKLLLTTSQSLAVDSSRRGKGNKLPRFKRKRRESYLSFLLHSLFPLTGQVKVSMREGFKELKVRSLINFDGGFQTDDFHFIDFNNKFGYIEKNLLNQRIVSKILDTRIINLIRYLITKEIRISRY